MTACERYLHAIDELVDGTLGPLRRAELELHVETCEGCRALLDDLRLIAGTARSLGPIEPPARVWTTVARQLRAERRGIASPPAAPRYSHLALALAAALVLAIGGSLVFLFSTGRSLPPAETAAADQHEPADAAADQSDAVQGVASEMALVEHHFQNVVEQASKSSGAIAPETVAELQKNMLDINRAIAESQAALQTDPQSVQARRSLYEMLKQKIQFLQDTIALMNEMRQGDAAGGSEIVEGKS